MSGARVMDGDRVTAGAILTAGREALDLSVSDVAQHLRLTPAQVAALEAGDFGRLPGRVFAMGFLRNYAKFLGIDPQPLLRSIDYDMPAPELVELRAPTEIVMLRERGPRWPLYSAAAAVLVVGALAVYEFGFNDPSYRGPTAPGEVPDAAIQSGDEPSQKAGAVPAQRDPADAPAAPRVPPSQESVLARNPSEKGRAGEGESANAVSLAERQLDLRFDQDSWVEIRDGNNKVIFSKLSRAGRQERVTGTPPFKVTVGNARGVQLKYEDKAVDLAPHTGVTVARVTLK